MLLKKVCTEFAIFEADDPNHDLENMLDENCSAFPEGPANDAPDGISSVDVSGVEGANRPKKKKRDQGNNLRDLITSFAICNNVTPVAEDPDLQKALDVAGNDGKGRATVQPARGENNL